MAENTNPQDSKLVGLLAQFDDPDSLVQACDQARQTGYTRMDAYSPFPVHGIDPALGIRRSILPFIVLGVALGATLVGLGLQFFANSNELDALSPFPGYAFNIGGKPIFSLPANIPVTFEIIVLSSAFATFLGMWFLNKLPMFSNPLHRVSRFKRATNDKFFLLIEQSDEKFDAAKTEAQLNQWGAVAVEECRQDLTDTSLPNWLRMAGVLAAILLLLPPVMIFRAKGMTNRHPRLHFMPDMDWQDKFKPQTVGPINRSEGYLFADVRSMRKPVEGSVEFGQLQSDTEMFQGIRKDWTPAPAPADATGAAEAAAAGGDDLSRYVTEFPAGVEVNDGLLARGQQRFNIYCSACHGYAGNGDGLINQHAMALALNGKASWTTAKSLHDPVVKDPAQNPVGRIFETITKGRNTMGPYGDQITAEDRWAIVAYVKALQETGIVPAGAAASEAPAKTPDGAGPQP